MKIHPRINLDGAVLAPDPWDFEYGLSLPLDHVICRDVDGTPHTIRELVWPWTAYTAHRRKIIMHFYYWNRTNGRVPLIASDVTPERESRIRELQFLMTRQIYFGNENSPDTLYIKLTLLCRIAFFAESLSCSVRAVLTQSALMDSFCAALPDQFLQTCKSWIIFLQRLDPESQLGFTPALPRSWLEVDRRIKAYRQGWRQYAPLPTRIYSGLINNLSAELDDIESHKECFLAALREVLELSPKSKALSKAEGMPYASAVIARHGLSAFFKRRGWISERQVRSIAGAVNEIFYICKLQISLFSGMRNAEARHLPYYCMVNEKSLHGREHFLIEGFTTKMNKGRRLRTKWVTIDSGGFRAIRLAQEFAGVIYEWLGETPSNKDAMKDQFPLFPSTEYLPAGAKYYPSDGHIDVANTRRFSESSALLSRLCLRVQDEDLSELEDIDPFRDWRGEFEVGQPWPLTPHQLRRSLAIYANASGMVRTSSLRRQLQHITREMTLYYGRGSSFCKNFVSDDSGEYKKHVSCEWQDGAEEAEMLAFVRDVLNSAEPLYGGSGAYYQRQRERGDVMSNENVAEQMKKGLLAYREGPLGGCTRPGVCEERMGLNLIDTVCATEGCKYLIGKHSKIVASIRLKRAGLAHVTPGSITEAMEREELEALERVERAWRPPEDNEAVSK